MYIITFICFIYVNNTHTGGILEVFGGGYMVCPPKMEVDAVTCIPSVLSGIHFLDVMLDMWIMKITSIPPKMEVDAVTRIPSVLSGIHFWMLCWICG